MRTLGVKHTVNVRERERIWELKNKRAKISNTRKIHQESQRDKEMFGSDLLAGDTNPVLHSAGELGFVLWQSCWSEELIQRSCKVHRALACATPQARPPQRLALARATTSSVRWGKNQLRLKALSAPAWLLRFGGSARALPVPAGCFSACPALLTEAALGLPEGWRHVVRWLMVTNHV